MKINLKALNYFNVAIIVLKCVLLILYFKLGCFDVVGTSWVHDAYVDFGSLVVRVISAELVRDSVFGQNHNF